MARQGKVASWWCRVGSLGLDDQEVGGVFVGDQPVGMLTLGVHGVGGQDPPGKLQSVQQGPEPGDLG